MDRLERLDGALLRANQLNLRVAQLYDAAEDLGLDEARYRDLAAASSYIVERLLEDQTLARALNA